MRIQGGRCCGSRYLSLNVSEIFLYTPGEQRITASAIQAYMENTTSATLDPRLCFDNNLNTSCGTARAPDVQAATLRARFPCPGGRATNTLDKIEVYINVDPTKKEMWYQVDILDREGRSERRFNISAAKAKHVLNMFDGAYECVLDCLLCWRDVCS